MRGGALIETQRLMAQAISALADHVEQSTGYQLTPVVFAKLPVPVTSGVLACITDSTVNTWGATVVGGGAFTVLAWYNGTNWKVVAA